MADDDLEPIDLEPVDPRAIDSEWRREQTRRRLPAWIWFALVGTGLAAWGIIAVGTRDERRAPAGPTSNTAPVDRLATLTSELRQGLSVVGVTRFAAVIGDRLYVLDDTSAATTRVPLPEGHTVIQDQSGESLLLSTFGANIVHTEPITSRTLSARETPIRGVAPTPWWIVRTDRSLRPAGSIGFDRGERVPAGLRLVSSVRDGFIALDPAGSRWVLWNGATMRKLAPADYQFLAAGADTIVFKHGCGYGGCAITILDLAHDATTTTSLDKIPEFAAFSPDETRLALVSTAGDPYILDLKDHGKDIGIGIHLQDASLPFAWTPDSRSLIVVTDHDVEIVHASNGVAFGIIAETQGVVQIAVLP